MLRAKPPLVLFGSYNERMYAAELGGRSMYIPASFPGAIVRRATGTPFMGYAGATYIVQEFCNALFDALFNILPLGTDLDRVEPTPDAACRELPMGRRRQALFDEYLETEPFLVRISAAKRMRDRVERQMRQAGEDRVTVERVSQALAELSPGTSPGDFTMPPPAAQRSGGPAGQEIPRGDPARDRRRGLSYHGNPSRAGWARQRPQGRFRRVTAWQ